MRLPVGRARVLLGLLMARLRSCCSGAPSICKCCNDDFLQQKGESRYARVLELPAHRGMITDRNGEPLAVSTPVESVWASPADVEVERRLSGASLLELLGMEASVRSPAGSPSSDREFVYLKRHLPPETSPRRSCSSAFPASRSSASTGAITRTAR